MKQKTRDQIKQKTQDQIKLLERRLRIQKANDIKTLSLAYENTAKTSKKDHMASGVTTIKNINADNNTIVEEE